MPHEYYDFMFAVLWPSFMCFLYVIGFLTWFDCECRIEMMETRQRQIEANIALYMAMFARAAMGESDG